ncbi:hypothetical protein EV426DRAFT_579028 [Tirmania nivea]|nr:hypothetical protein EV426DRAFT_579028 [Tirmania nivea]
MTDHSSKSGHIQYPFHRIRTNISFTCRHPPHPYEHMPLALAPLTRYEEDFNHLYHTVTSCLRKCTPTLSKWPCPGPWWNTNLAEMRRNKNHLFREFRAGRRTSKNNYNAARNAYLRAIKKATAKHWNEVCENTDPPSLWNTVRKAFPKPAASIVTINGPTTFEDKAAILRQRLFPPPPPSSPHIPSMNMTGFIAVLEKEVENAIQAIPPSTAPGDDTFPTSGWKTLHLIRPDILTAMAD